MLEVEGSLPPAPAGPPSVSKSARLTFKFSISVTSTTLRPRTVALGLSCRGWNQYSRLHFTRLAAVVRRCGLFGVAPIFTARLEGSPDAQIFRRVFSAIVHDVKTDLGSLIEAA